MRSRLWASGFLVVAILAGPIFAAAPAGSQVPAASQVDLTASPVAVLTDEDIEQFLLNAKVLKTISFSKGATKARRVSMSDGRMTHDAQIQDVNIEKAIFEVGPKHTEINFKDLFRYNVAAYRLSRLLGLTNVPVSVERVVDGDTLVVRIGREKETVRLIGIDAPDPSSGASETSSRLVTPDRLGTRKTSEYVRSCRGVVR